MIGLSSLCMVSCNKDKEEGFRYLLDEFADLKVIRYTVPGWDGLSLQQSAEKNRTAAALIITEAGAQIAKPVRQSAKSAPTAPTNIA